MSDVIEKMIGDIFSDCQSLNRLKTAKIKKVNLYKKTNRFELMLEVSEVIDLKEIQDFEQYLITRFRFE